MIPDIVSEFQGKEEPCQGTEEVEKDIMETESPVLYEITLNEF